MADVFISYARADEAVARRVAKALQGAGLDVWWDADLPAHRAYSEVIERELAEAKAVIVLWSKTSAASQWVRAEADCARNKGNLVQAQIDGTLPPMPFNQIQCADLSGWRGSAKHAGWSKVEASIKSLVPGDMHGAPAPTRRFAASGRLLPYGWIMAAVLALIVAAGVYVYAFGPPGQDRKPVLAVLPFRNFDPQDASLVSGIWEDTRAAIGRNPQLIVLGPKTAEQLANKGEGAARKAADYLIQASVRRAGDRIRVTANLVRTKSGEQLWGEAFDRKLDDVFGLQTQIANEIEGRIRGRLAAKGGTIAEHIATSGEVYVLYADARAKIRKRDPELLDTARDQLREVVRRDPNFAPGWATMAEVLTMLLPFENDGRAGGLAEQYARKAIDLAPNLAAAHASLALTLQNKGSVALAELTRAVQLDPNDYEALNWLGAALQEAGDKEGALDAYSRAAELEPFFWPAAVNKLRMLQELDDRTAIRRFLARERELGAVYVADWIEMDVAQKNGQLAKAANLGLQYWGGSQTEARAAIGFSLWSILAQLGYFDEAYKVGPAPDFAIFLWRNDPKGLDLLESHGFGVRMFFALQPLTESAGRVYLLSGRSRKLADLYISMKLSPEQFLGVATGDGPEHFLYSAPLVALALRQNGHSQEAASLLTLAEVKAREGLRTGKPLNSVLLARIYATEGRKQDALSLLSNAVAKGWLPQPPELMMDLRSDPALTSLNGDPRFERLRSQILGTINRERAKVDQRLLRQLNAA